MVSIRIERERERERENASEKMVGICVKRENTLRHFFVISNRSYKLIEFQFVKLCKLIVII